jgi:hypothetical protein
VVMGNVRRIKHYSSPVYPTKTRNTICQRRLPRTVAADYRNKLAPAQRQIYIVKGRFPAGTVPAEGFANPFNSQH